MVLSTIVVSISSNMSLRSGVAVVLGVGIISEVLYFLYKRRVYQGIWSHFVTSSATQKPATKATPRTDFFHQVLFFPDAMRSCPDHFWSDRGCNRIPCPFTHEVTNFSRMAEHMLKAKETLDVCVYTISNNDLADFVIRLHESGVVVRVITDDEAVNMSGTYIGRFRGAGIQVRRDYSSYLMHHKFVVIDNATLINGSMNWTCHAVNSNNENVLVTNNPEIVQPYITEYERLWEVFDPAKRPN